METYKVYFGKTPWIVLDYLSKRKGIPCSGPKQRTYELFHAKPETITLYPALAGFSLVVGGKKKRLTPHDVSAIANNKYWVERCHSDSMTETPEGDTWSWDYLNIVQNGLLLRKFVKVRNKRLVITGRGRKALRESEMEQKARIRRYSTKRWYALNRRWKTDPYKARRELIRELKTMKSIRYIHIS